MSKKIRADELLVLQKLAESRSKAKAYILAGQVLWGEHKIQKSSQLLPSDAQLALKNQMPYVGRGGLKMENFLNDSNWSISGVNFLDLGASTGGFTDCLLQKGAKTATCVDVGRGQLHYRLRIDDRVTNLEKMNLKTLTQDDLPQPYYPLIVMDLSFISLRKVIRQAWQFLEPGGRLATLVKPQFECKKEEANLGKGIIKDSTIHQRVLDEIKSFVRQELTDSNLIIETTSRPTGNDGNKEFFLGWVKGLKDSTTGIN